MFNGPIPIADDVADNDCCDDAPDNVDEDSDGCKDCIDSGGFVYG